MMVSESVDNYHLLYAIIIIGFFTLIFYFLGTRYFGKKRIYYEHSLGNNLKSNLIAYGFIFGIVVNLILNNAVCNCGKLY